ncbi:MAG: heat shock protein Hsp20 [Firmicutes bacterium]|nr:heat shock protein Hsp20 [Bacillota bacterium]
MFGLIPYRDKGLLTRDHFSQLMHSFLEDDLFVPMANGVSGSFQVDLRETEAEYIVEADLPGIKKEDITLRYENKYLTIAAQRNETQELTNEGYVRKERRYGQFQRSIYVDNVVEERIAAKFDEGVLTVVLPKSDKGEKRRGNIQIN